ncbi:ParB/RepB/Spo0J family partition protein [Thiomicrorhabdus lithotrophica]|uniref:Probable chromosome-partitioning protein ParB n=1 Tax=Thiomicrorhabdus lithotrophica TaxID=2949997 RepID=A0ABY8CDY7_9GAMM|nr:ParB/RepB/Spo0J family partition protein [Thiomicrorhabdus lithotrophica]WEJ62623.1 ParB/RepB/Spo0J family partition protein [Thiomicrorhabdus lithotrophica]
MVKKRSGMGTRGIHAMLGAKQKSDNSSADLRIEKLLIDQLQPGQYQPRQQFEEAALQELADSIKVQGVVQPIIVRPVGTDKYEIIAGERRWRASKLAGLEKVPVVIRQADSQATLAMALIENIQREDLNPIETAIGLKRLLKEFDLTQQAVADAVGRSRAAVSNLLRLLKLPKGIQNALHEGRLSMGHARAIISLPEEIQKELVDKAMDRGWSVREIEEAAQQVLVPKKLIRTAKKKAIPGIEQVINHQQILGDKLSAKVKINHHETGRGKIEISYKDMDELERLLKLF